VAISGPEAVTLFSDKRNEINLAVTETDIPIMDARATCIAIKRINPELKIIMASGTVPNENENRRSTDNVNAFVPRPYTVAQLLTTVHDVLAAKS